MSGAPEAACRRCGAPEPRAFTTPVVDCSGRLLIATSVFCACGGTTLVGLRPARTVDGPAEPRQHFPFTVY
ncbi:hypothetical protein [Streptomyces sp. NPDC018045]|uniref:hypothetical protein n=1 Tax=Streptomyces sp. NPDC018045 TaxID=3365037 RepID=UPI0037AF92D5